MAMRFVLLASALCLIVSNSRAQTQTQKTTDPALPAEKVAEAKPPAGWKEHSPKDGTYAVFVPEKSNRQSERERTLNTNGARIKINQFTLLVNGGGTYQVEEAILSANLSKNLKREDLMDLFRDETARNLGGKINNEMEVKTGNVSGKEYRVEGGKSAARFRLYVTANRARVLIVIFSGSPDQLDGDNARIFLESARLTAAKKQDARGIVGGGNDPEFRDTAPTGAYLSGLEVGLSEVFDSETIKAIRPIYRDNGKDTPGKLQGSEQAKVVKLIAKPGYAVAGLSVKAGAGLDGLSIKFMKVVEGKLDPKDSYESEWVGGKGTGNPVKLGGDGTLVTGIMGKASAGSQDVTGLGLIFQDAAKKN